MTERKKLALKPPGDSIDPETLNKKGRGWKISDKSSSASPADKAPAISLEGSVG